MTSSLNEGGTAVFRPSFSFLSFFGECDKPLQVRQDFTSSGERFDLHDSHDQLVTEISKALFYLMSHDSVIADVM